MPANLGTYPLQDPITDGDGNLTPSWERVLRGMYANTQGAVKPVGYFSAISNSVTLPANTLKSGSNMDIVATFASLVALGGSAKLSIGSTVIATFAYDNTRPFIVLRATVNIVSGALATFAIWSATAENGTSGANGLAFTIPDMTQPITISVDVSEVEFISVRTYT